jgi:S1-C subfamily serine protease
VSARLKPKDVAVFTIVRDGKRQKLAVTLAARQLPSD